MFMFLSSLVIKPLSAGVTATWKEKTCSWHPLAARCGQVTKLWFLDIKRRHVYGSESVF